MVDYESTALIHTPTRRIGLWLLIILLFSASAWATKPLTYKIKGLDKALLQNATLYLDNLPVIKPEQLDEYRHEIQEALQKSLMALGYYQPTIDLRRGKKPANQLIIDINPGKPVIVQSLQINLEGDARKDRAFTRLIRQNPLKVGDTLNDGEYEALKTGLNNLALTRGYFDARLTEHQIKVYPDKQTADITLTMKSGRRYRFGPIIYDAPVSEATRELLNTMINFQPGQPYRSERLSQLNMDFSATGFFKSIEVRPLQDKAVDGEVPIFVSVSPKTAWELETGIGFSTDEGPRVSLNIVNPWLDQKGHSFTSDIKVSRTGQELSGRYKIPYGNPLLEYYSLDSGYQRTSLQDTDSQLVSASINKWKKRPGNWDQDFFIRVDYENYTQGLQNSSNLLLIPGMSFDRRKVVGNPTDPRSGHLYNLKIETSAKAWQSDADFIKVWGRAKWLTTFFRHHRFISRIEQGAIRVDDIENIPPSIRFFTGGDQTIRGYSYDSISPRDSSGQLVGGQYLSVASIEYDYEIIENWRVALFVDSGTATNAYKKGQVEWYTGTGPGIRWVTPLGPVKLDFAFAVSEPGAPWRIHFSMGPDL
ncbi:autotransporter assembly complex family protein [Endozoicomonas sp. ONNA2]|uniref:autotransporter assembly complex protein TamA n=1 Tax=Endozoicomonas sp. ONNA2 TaxID=2828741 RepID=UPI0021478EBA|nr:autotransporter assembly complex family protein [Endozoicomonas sp. ONNA2]